MSVWVCVCSHVQHHTVGNVTTATAVWQGQGPALGCGQALARVDAPFLGTLHESRARRNCHPASYEVSQVVHCETPDGLQVKAGGGVVVMMVGLVITTQHT